MCKVHAQLFRWVGRSIIRILSTSFVPRSCQRLDEHAILHYFFTRSKSQKLINRIENSVLNSGVALYTKAHVRIEVDSGRSEISVCVPTLPHLLLPPTSDGEACAAGLWITTVKRPQCSLPGSDTALIGNALQPSFHYQGP